MHAVILSLICSLSSAAEDEKVRGDAALYTAYAPSSIRAVRTGAPPDSTRGMRQRLVGRIEAEEHKADEVVAGGGELQGERGCCR